VTTAVRISNFVLNRYPPVLSSVYALAFGAGGIGLFAALGGERITASAIPMLGIVAVTLFADLLIMRVLDDIRDQDYDRLANPQRPVASGAVPLRDLSTLIAVCATVIVVVNLSFHAGLVVVIGQLLYVAALMAVGQRFPATRGDNLVLNVLVGFPVQLLLYAYLIAAFTKIRDGAPTAVVGGLGILILTLCASQVEFGKKLARRPATGERSYTNSLGYVATSLLTIGTGPLAVALFAIAAQVSPLSKALVALPAIGVAGFAIRYFRRKDNRWPAAVSTLGLLGTLIAFAVVGVVG
jgi:4-hydroxybenzoate polyprenyltransferase